MPLTADQRAEINRQNASHSTGPSSDEGKASSRRNALKHGLRARALALPNEDPEAVAGRAEAWNGYYDPRSPGAQHLVNECVAATLLSDRCHKYHEAALAKQVRDARVGWEVGHEERVEGLLVLMKTDPATAVRKLLHTAHGCRELIERWERLDRILAEKGYWHAPERDEAIRLQGFEPELDMLKGCPEAWVTRLFAICCHEKPSGVVLEKMFQAHHLPEAYRGEYRADWLPLPEDCLQSLRRMAADKLEPLRALEEELRLGHEEPDREGAEARALVLHDGPSARLFLRYHSEARNAFQKAFNALLKTLDRDAAGAPAPAPDVPPNEATPAPSETPAPAEETSPNEATSGEKRAGTAPHPSHSDPSEPSEAPPAAAQPVFPDPGTPS